MFGDFRVSARRVPFLQCLIFLVALCVAFAVLAPPFLSPTNLDNILTASAVVGLLAIGQTFVIASGGIDLSVASILALAGSLCAFYLRLAPDTSPYLAVLICCVIGSSAGFVNGILVVLTRAPSFIVTLGMLSVARALAYIVAEGTPIYGLPSAVTDVAQNQYLGVSGPVVILLGAGLVSFVLFHHTRFGSHLLAYGDNRDAAIATGISPANLLTRIYTLSGGLAGLAGFVFMARTNCGDPTAGQNYELVAITAVVLGGASLYGGRATVLGSVFGVLCLGVLQNGLNLLAVSTYYQVLFVGLVLIAAASLERWRQSA